MLRDIEMVERVARALMRVTAAPPCSDGRELPVLDLDPDFDDLPHDHTQGTPDDPITQEAVLRLARAAMAEMREPTELMFMKGGNVPPSKGIQRQWTKRIGDMAARDAWRTMIDTALKDPTK